MASVLQHGWLWLRAPAQQLAFAVRSRLRLHRGRAKLPHEAKPDPLPWLPALAPERERAARLLRDYRLHPLHACSTRLVYAENLALLDRLDALAADLPRPWTDQVAAVDVGAGAFQYATALQRWLAGPGAVAPAAVRLCGIEVDGYRLYRDGHARADHAHSHAALAGAGTRYLVADFLSQATAEQDVVTLFYPFLASYALLQWGAPPTLLRPRRLLQRAVAALRPGGWLVVANQTAAEFVRLQQLLADQPVRLLRQESFATSLLPYAERTAGRVGSLWQRHG